MVMAIVGERACSGVREAIEGKLQDEIASRLWSSAVEVS